MSLPLLTRDCTKRVFARLSLIVALAMWAGGCAAYKATQQPGKKDLSVLSSGTPRSHVIAELGAPVWSEERDGKRVDLFSFKQGYTKPVKAGRALLHGAADVVTGGLWEVVGIPAETMADGSDVKVEVVYDDRRAVKTTDVIAGQNLITPRRWFGNKQRRKPMAVARSTKRSSEISKPASDESAVATADDSEEITADYTEAASTVDSEQR